MSQTVNAPRSSPGRNSGRYYMTPHDQYYAYIGNTSGPNKAATIFDRRLKGSSDQPLLHGLPYVRYLSGGSYGSTYVVHVDKNARNYMHMIRGKMTFKAGTEIPKLGTDVVLKVQKTERLDGYLAHRPRWGGPAPHKEFTEAALQRSLYNSRASWKGRIVYGKSVAPKVYFSGYLKDKSEGHRVHITCMEFVKGVPLYKMRMTRALNDVLSKTILTMWLNSVTHTDLHGANVMVSKESGKYSVRIIDYGLASKLPKRIVDQVARRMALGTAPSDFRDAYRTIISPYLQSKNPHFRHSGFHANSEILDGDAKEGTTRLSSGPEPTYMTA